MRTSLRMTSTLLPFCTLACVVSAACFSQSSGGSSPGPVFDAATGDVFGDDSTTPEDGAAPEGSPLDSTAAADVGSDTFAPVDAAAADVVEAGAPVTVTVINGAGYEAGVQVIFQDASGNVLGAPTTGPGGVASLVVPAGSVVTVVMGPPSALAVYTVLGLQPGQQVPVQDWTGFTAPSVDVTTLPSSPALSGVTDYGWALGAGQQYGLSSPSSAEPWSANPAPMVGYTLGAYGANVGAITSSVVEAQDESGDVAGFATVKDLPIASPDAGTLDLDFGATWSTTTTTQTVTAGNPDAGAFDIQSGSFVSEVTDGVLMPLSLDFQVYTHVGFADFLQTEVEFNQQNWGIVVSMTAPPTASGTIAVDASGLASAPAFTDASVSMNGDRPTLSWTLAQGTLAGITGLVAITPFNLSTGDGGAVNGTWTLVSPGTAQSSIAAPALPPLEGMAGAFGTTTVFAVTGQTAVTTYAELLKMGTAFAPIGGCVSGPFVPPLPSVGTALVSVFGSGSGC